MRRQEAAKVPPSPHILILLTPSHHASPRDFSHFLDTLTQNIDWPVDFPVPCQERLEMAAKSLRMMPRVNQTNGVARIEVRLPPPT